MRPEKIFAVGAMIMAVALGAMAAAEDGTGVDGDAAARPASLHVYTDAELRAIAHAVPASQGLPLGDRHYVLDGPRQGYIYLCHPMAQITGGAERAGDWIRDDRWYPDQKPSVEGQVEWSEAQFSNSIQNGQRILSGNGLPLHHPTGRFPIEPSDPASAYDRNPNRIRPQTIKDALPLDPVYADEPFCMGGESGIMLTGVPLFNGFDAGMRDAAAHEIQDRCAGHPQVSGEYHYHSLSPCIADIGEKTVIGYALDGFPITGPVVAPGRYLTTNDLDECHGLTSSIIEDGVAKITYHYVMTLDFPYSVSCFRARPVRTGPSDQAGPGRRSGSAPQNFSGPPPEALAACGNLAQGSPCAFTSPRGDAISGDCRTPPGQDSLACVPGRAP